MTTSTPEAKATAPRFRWPESWDIKRRRQAVALAVAGVLVIVLIVGLAVGLSGGSPAPPETGAARLVPANALGYLNVSLDRSRPGVAQALRVASRMPGFALADAAVDQRLGELTGSGASFSGSSRPWLGDEASLAVLPVGTAGAQAGSLLLLAVRQPAAARRYLASLPAASTVYYRGAEIRALSGGSYVALAGGYLVAGQLASVRQAIDVAHGASSLASNALYQRTVSGEPAGRALDLYAPAGGIAALLGARSGALGALRVLLEQAGLSAASASLAPASGGLRLQVHSVFPSGSVRRAGGSLDTSVLRRLPAGVAFALGTQSLPPAAPRLLSAASQLGIGGAIAPLLGRLGRALHAEGYNVAPLLKLFSGPTAVAVTDDGGHPGLLVLTRTNSPSAARIVLANLAPALTSLFPAASSGPGVAPLFNGVQRDGMIIHQVQLGSGLQLNYAILHDLVGVSTSVAALESLGAGRPTLGGSAAYRTAFGSGDSGAGSLVFLDLKVLIRLGEQTGLLRGSLAPDLDRISVVGLQARSNKTESTSELYFKIP